MICPACQGTGLIQTYPEPFLMRHIPCDYPGCHQGRLHCCEGDRATNE